ncbi:MAG: trimethylamine methyltransferase [Rhizobiales bacterium]|nr:trimethylamine methyltransferase [Hyphomicrobiales bacterium]
MTESVDRAARAGRRTSRRPERARTAPRATNYRIIENRLPFAEVFSADEVATIHETSLRVLEELGLKVLHAGARAILGRAGARVDEAEQMVYIDRGMVTEALARAPRSFVVAGQSPGRHIPMGGRSLMFGIGAGCPNITDLDRGRRPGTLADFEETIRIQQCFDIMPKLGPAVEPQDVPAAIRHLAATEVQLRLSDKVPFVYARGSGQTLDSFEMICIEAGITMDDLKNQPRTFTVINTNSPRQLDIPMAQGIIDFAEWGQPTVITPFCLAGAMAPITIAGALTLSHAEALAGITLAEVVRPGAPVVYGAFSTNVDMRSGAPVFGTPEHIKTNFGAGQLARHIGLPWRSAAGSASNAPDVQGANETQLALWGALLAGANFIYHAAGWLEGGLTFSCEKFITDLEVCQSVAEVMLPVEVGRDAIGFSAIAEVAPGGHFFSASQTMARYGSAFYEPLVADWSNFGQWSEAGAVDATRRANRLWKRVLADFEAPPKDPSVLEALADFVARRTREGGSPPVG